MKVPGLIIYFLVCAGFTFSGCVYALETDFRGQLSAWTREAWNQDTWENFTGLRYVPQLSLKQPVSDDSFFDAEVSLNGYWSTGSGEAGDQSGLELYRAKLRWATAQTETRLGLQKINFGPARLLRSLRWFDRLDPTDPLQLTKGVYGLRFKYDALNNAGLWLWGLYGNEEPKGYETLATARGNPEFGGRWQYPVGPGELAATVHARNVDGSESGVPDFPERRLALDGQWDVGIGLWFEAVFQHQETDALTYDTAKMITIGLDYTFGVGNGLHFLFEHMAMAFSGEPFGWDEDQEISAFSLSYPIGLFDSLRAIGYYFWDQQGYFQYLGWQRTYDTLVLALSLFYYPEDLGIAPGQNAFISGSGGQFMIIINH